MPTPHHGGDDAAPAGERPPPTSSLPASPSDVSVALPARLVTATRGEWRAKLGELAHAAIDSAVRQGRAEIVLDLGETTEVDVSGLGFVVAVQRQASDRGLAVRLLGVSPPIRALLAATRLDALFLVNG